MIWGLPRETHKYWIEPLAGVHIDTQIKSNQIGFLRKAKYNNKRITRLIFQKTHHNLNSITGSNLRTITDDAINHNIITKFENVLEVAPKLFKRSVKYESFPTDQVYRIQMLDKLITLRDREFLLNNIDFEDKYIVDLINYLCIN